MALGTTRTRNWGKEDQAMALSMALRRRGAAYQIRNGYLYLSASKAGVILPFNQSCAQLVNVRRGRWEARHPWDGRILSMGVSERDVVRSTIEKVWN